MTVMEFVEGKSYVFLLEEAAEELLKIFVRCNRSLMEF